MTRPLAGIVGLEVHDELEAVDAAGAVAPDVVVLDLGLPSWTAEVCRQLFLRVASSDQGNGAVTDVLSEQAGKRPGLAALCWARLES